MTNATAKNVYLVAGQVRQVEGNSSLAPEVVQRVVVAANDSLVYSLLSRTDPNFQPLGYATLFEYEATAAKVRASLRGEGPRWPVLVAQDLNVTFAAKDS